MIDIKDLMSLRVQQLTFLSENNEVTQKTKKLHKKYYINFSKITK